MLTPVFDVSSILVSNLSILEYKLKKSIPILRKKAGF